MHVGSHFHIRCDLFSFVGELFYSTHTLIGNKNRNDEVSTATLLYQVGWTNLDDYGVRHE